MKRVKLNQRAYNRGVDDVLTFRSLRRQFYTFYLCYVRGHLYKAREIDRRHKKRGIGKYAKRLSERTIIPPQRRSYDG